MAGLIAARTLGGPASTLAEGGQEAATSRHVVPPPGDERGRRTLGFGAVRADVTMESKRPLHDLFRAFGLSDESVERVKFGRGVVGRTTHAVVAVMLVLAVAAFRMDPDALLRVVWIAAGIFVVYFVGVLWFAARKPEAALMEGTELLRWRQTELAVKGGGRIPPAPALPENPAPKDARPPSESGRV